MSAPGVAWAALAGALAAAAVLAGWAPAPALDWQPARAAAEPWRAFSAAFVHWSLPHLVANLAGTAVVAAFGWTARLPWRATLAWAAAWPLTHLGLLPWPALVHYGGLSGVLHAGVVVGAAWLVVRDRGGRRGVGALVAAGLGLKLLLEQPWGPLLRPQAGWDVAVAPLAHATGAVAGLLCAAVALVVRRDAPRAGHAARGPMP